MSSFDEQLDGELELLAARNLLRTPTKHDPNTLVLCSNDYLGYGSEPLSSLPVADVPSGAGASRLISGDHPAHADAEKAMAAWVACDTSLLLSSGYAANVGVVSSLAGPNDVIVSDALNHASLIDGCRLSRARVVVAEHASLEAMDRALAGAAHARRRWLITESYFSMDGDTVDLAALRRLADTHAAFLIVDEAHALGVFGPEGGGRCREAGVRADVTIGTLGKALGLAGAFVAGSPALRAWLWNRARSFVFSTGVPPWLAAAASARVGRVRTDRAARRRLEQIVQRVREELTSWGAPIHPRSVGPILPWLVGDAKRVLHLRDQLLEQGVFVQAIRPPTVPDGTARLRITLHAKLTDACVSRALEALRSCL